VPGIGVQVVGRFVEQQHVRGRQQQAAQRHATLLATRQHLNPGVPGGQAQRVGGHFQLAVQVVAVGRLQDRFELRLFSRQLVEVGIRLSVFGIHLVKTRLRILDHADRLLDHFTHGLGRVQLGLLGKITDVQFRHRAGFTIELGVNPGHDFQQRGLTRTVEAEHADLGARKEREGDILEDFTLGRHNFAQPMHGKYVLSHVMKTWSYDC
jgi:hypothetical protein